MLSKEQIDRIVDAIENISPTENVIVRLDVEDYNNISYIGENLCRIADCLERIEAHITNYQ